jgi:hypothetical protein
LHVGASDGIPILVDDPAILIIYRGIISLHLSSKQLILIASSSLPTLSGKNSGKAYDTSE